MMKLPLIMFPVLLSGVVAECQDDEECVLASYCIQLIPGPQDQTAVFFSFDEQICENGGLTREKKVCCSNVLEKNDLDTPEKIIPSRYADVPSRFGHVPTIGHKNNDVPMGAAGGSELGFGSPIGGSHLTPDEGSRSCPSTGYNCEKRNKSGRRFCCQPFVLRSGESTCRRARRCYAL